MSYENGLHLVLSAEPDEKKEQLIRSWSELRPLFVSRVAWINKQYKFKADSCELDQFIEQTRGCMRLSMTVDPVEGKEEPVIGLYAYSIRNPTVDPPTDSATDSRNILFIETNLQRTASNIDAIDSLFGGIFDTSMLGYEPSIKLDKCVYMGGIKNHPIAPKNNRFYVSSLNNNLFLSCSIEIDPEYMMQELVRHLGEDFSYNLSCPFRDVRLREGWILGRSGIVAFMKSREWHKFDGDYHGNLVTVEHYCPSTGSAIPFKKFARNAI